MKSEEIFAVIDRHFEFEKPDMLEHVIETYADEIIWEAPARNLVLRDYDKIVAHYREIVGGMIDPKMDVLRRLASGNEAFDDRVVYFIAGKNNVWGIKPGKHVKLRLAHYFKLKGDKICQEIGYEMWQDQDEVFQENVL